MFRTADRSYPPDIDPSELEHRITFLESTIVPDAGGSSVTWAPGDPPLTVSAKIEEISAAEVIKGGSDISQVRTTITVRYRKEITANMRIQLADGAQFLIEGPNNIRRKNIWLILTCLGVGANA